MARSTLIDASALVAYSAFQGRLERLRRSRWQWFSMVLLMLVVRLQFGLPLVIELTVVLQFLLFLALPVRAEERIGTARKWNSYGV